MIRYCKYKLDPMNHAWKWGWHGYLWVKWSAKLTHIRFGFKRFRTRTNIFTMWIKQLHANKCSENRWMKWIASAVTTAPLLIKAWTPWRSAGKYEAWKVGLLYHYIINYYLRRRLAFYFILIFIILLAIMNYYKIKTCVWVLFYPDNVCSILTFKSLSHNKAHA